jgi:hypothetical protein
VSDFRFIDGECWVKAADHDRVVRTLRAKVMRERADAHERCAYLIGLGTVLYAFTFDDSRCSSLHARARRLRAKADRIERGEA